MAPEMKRVEGRDAGDVVLYALSTCGWCKKTKRLLGELGVGYRYIDVDQLDRADRRAVEEQVMSWNPRGSFPTIVIGNKNCIVGFKEDQIREALGS